MLRHPYADGTTDRSDDIQVIVHQQKGTKDQYKMK